MCWMSQKRNKLPIETVTKSQKSHGPIISIIIPVYNVSDYIKKCIESAVNQTYSNI